MVVLPFLLKDAASCGVLLSCEYLGSHQTRQSMSIPTLLPMRPFLISSDGDTTTLVVFKVAPLANLAMYVCISDRFAENAGLRLKKEKPPLKLFMRKGNALRSTLLLARQKDFSAEP